ncbi:MAG: CinA family nicotinamide mononucleotide deamidase-related protein [Elusimicrobia bacterium]|nr:CinA family nicotinamide mononucleotide deamidase-related protein [Elusimicrobiota bacterium]
MRPPRAPRAYLVCVGSELLAGQLNTHQAWLSLRLRRRGFDVAGESSVPDSAAAIKTALRRALDAADAVIVCGGLGPTFDDVTREAAAAALGRKLRFAPKLWRAIRARLARRLAAVPEENRRQAEVLAGAEVLANAAGSAPGQRLEFRWRDGRPRSLILLPGPYSEMAPIFERVLPRLAARHARGAGAGLVLRLAGVPESVADERLDAVRARFPAASFTILASGGEVSFHAAVRARTAAAARGELKRLRRRALDAVGQWCFGEGDATLESALGLRLRESRLTLAVAESCTGGLLGGRLTSVPGSSAWFYGGVIAYDNALKTKLLGVSSRLLRAYGAVSAQCAEAMAAGARRAAGTDIGVSITGVAGPDGGTKDKPVGLVHIAVSGPGTALLSRRHDLRGSRETVRSRAASAALTLLQEALDGPSLTGTRLTVPSRFHRIGAT